MSGASETLAAPSPFPASLEPVFARARAATPEAPLRVMTSACLLGHVTGWDGQGYPEDPVLHLASLPNVHAVPFCPEAFRLPVPRPFTTIFGGTGDDVRAGRARVLGTDGEDVTARLVRGVGAMRSVARRERVEVAVLMDVSDSCGSHVIYDGDPADKRYRAGRGVAAASLHAAGVPIIAQRDHRSLGHLLACLDPTYALDPTARDFVDHPWFRETFPEQAAQAARAPRPS